MAKSKNKLKKKAQAATGAATLVIIIAVIIVAYLVMVPEETRDDIIDGIEENDNGGNGNGDINEDVTVLLEASPGTIYQLDDEDQEIEHSIANLRLFSEKESMIITEIKVGEVEKGWFVKKELIKNFTIDDLEHTKDILINFNAPERDGKLYVYVNGEMLYNKKMESQNLRTPISIPKDILEEENELRIKVSGVGLLFWDTNYYSLEEIKIIGDYENVDGLKSTQIFEISTTEHNNIEQAELKFVPTCQQANVGRLKISVNDYLLSSAIADCGTPTTIVIPSQRLIAGENEISFENEKGVYLIEQIRILTRVKEMSQMTYYFEIDEDEYEDLVDDVSEIWLRMLFIDDINEKEGEISFNWHKKSFETDDKEFEIELTEYVVEDEWVERNWIQIIPKNTMEIYKFYVELREAEE